jgi:hypothetical protein
MNENQIEMVSRIKKILNDEGYHLKKFNIFDVPTGMGYREYISAISLEAEEFQKEKA